MAVPAAVAKLPWKQIILFGADLLRIAKDMYNKWFSKPKLPPVDPHAEVKVQIAAITQRLEILEATEADQIKLVKEMAEQLQTLSIEIGRVSVRNTILMWVTGSVVVLSCIALVVTAR